jgi:hypothetical protein
MLSGIGSSITASNNSAQIAALQKQLIQYEKQFQADESVGNESQGSGAQLLASQITLVETEISQLDAAGVEPVASSGPAAAAAAISSGATLGKNIDVTA